jgi:catechol 2,3-dioxygenase-like lactoylglutathione lyase family enzyme
MGSTQAGRSNGVKRNSIPARLHHNAYVCRDLEATRKFYEGTLGWPLAAVWREHDRVFDDDLEYCHLFFQIGDGGMLAFFRFADPAKHEKYAQYGPHSPFVHIALKVDEETQKEIRRRLEADGFKTDTIDHGYCVSLYVTDPNGLNLEFAADHPDWDKICAKRAASADADFKAWLAGDRTTNNEWRPPEPASK